MLLIPVLLRPCVWKAHRWLKDRQMIPRDGQSVAVDFAGDLADTVFTAVAEHVWAHFEQPAGLRVPATSTTDQGIIPPPVVVPWPQLPPERLDLTRLPETGSALFGRDEELRLLDEAWVSSQHVGSMSIRVLAFTANGGVGKSTLVNRWLDEMSQEHFRGATRVFGWSFYSQGVRQRDGGLRRYFHRLRRYASLATQTRPPAHPGTRANVWPISSAARALLVLDGLEPLQSAHAFDRGKLRDPALASLLRGLARHSDGLCLITTREPLVDLAGGRGVDPRPGANHPAGGPRAAAHGASGRNGCGTGGPCERGSARTRWRYRCWAFISTSNPATALVRPRRSNNCPAGDRSTECWPASSNGWATAPNATPCSLLGLFDRPADAGCLARPARQPRHPRSDRPLGWSWSDADWEPRPRPVAQSSRLIHVRPGGHRPDGSVDAHPLLREYFARQLRAQQPEAWRAAHRRLYEHLCATTQDKRQPTLEDLQPLYQAVAHGCQAGLQQEACDKVYCDRIQRRSENSTARRNSARSVPTWEPSPASSRPPWSRVSPALTEADQAWLLNEAAFRLRALGRLTEALEPMRAAAGDGVQAQRTGSNAASRSASNLSELELTLGEVAGAVGDAEQSVTYADRSGDAFQRMGKRTTHADALHQAGRRAEAEARFREAEQMQAERQPEYPLLYSLQGFRYCDLLLPEAERAAWQTDS